MAREMGALAEARREFRAALEKDPGDASAKKQLDEINQLR